MKPNFALTLSFDGIGLLHRAGAGWHSVGEVSLDSSNLATKLADLRALGLALDPSGMTTQLVIPDEQIKFLSFSAADADHDALEQAVRDNLTGATPYALEDLVYDWTLDAGQVHVAAVARETLAEAEEFVSTYAFNPVSFGANPRSGQFAGAPWFGKTAQAGQHIPEGEALDPDTAPIHVLGPAPPPPSDDADTADIPAFDPADSAATPALADTAQSDADTAPDLDAAQAPDAAQIPDETHTPDAAPDPEAIPDPDAVSDPQAPDDPETDDPETEQAPGPPPIAAPGADQTPAPAFRSIRATRDEPSAPPAAPRLEGADRSLRTPDEAPPVTGQPEDALSERNASRLAASLAAEPQDRLHPAPAEPPVDTSAASFFARRSTEPVPATVAAPPPPADEKQRMTIFGAREPVEIGGKPRYLGLILTALLLLFLIVVAAWASVFAEDGIARLFRGAPEPQIAEVPKRPDPAPSQSQSQPAPTDLAALPDSDPDADAPTTTDTSSLTARPDPTELSPDEALARYAATGIWLMAPDAPSAPGLITLDDFYQTSIDTQVRSSDAVALPDMRSLRHEARPQTPAAPAPAGTRFTVDERGLVVATPEGALTPQGVRVFAGRPGLTPPALPDRPTAIASALPEAETARLLGVRPQLRPDTLAEQNQRASLGAGGRSLAELATLRPRLRPPSAQQAAQQTAQQAAAATPNVDPDAVAAALAEAASEPDPFATATPQAVTASLKPNPRPNNFDRTVARTREAEQATPVAANQRMAPSAPTATTVARAATDQNVISLRQVNLIGVYGTPTNRRALVRLANGRYEKVKVGDRLDGGQVAAIGNDELRYLKRGRNIVLKMPRG